MRSPHRLSTGRLLLHPLAACLAAAFGIGNAAFANGPGYPKGMIVVTNCNDSGAGSLRAAVQDDVASDPIDLTQLACSQITLTSGAIHTSRSLTLVGPGSDVLAIDGNSNDRILVEDAAGSTLAIYGMSLQHGHVTSASGGCIYSAGSVILGDVVVTGCSISGAGAGSESSFRGAGLYAKANLTASDSRIVGNEIDVTSAYALGGGVFTAGYASFVNSTISENMSRTTTVAGGGGIWVNIGLTMDYSTVSGNRAESDYSVVGGVKAGFFRVNHSTISGNMAEGGGGILGDNLCCMSYLTNSTVSGNTAKRSGGVDARHISVYNSTIALNVATEPYECAGLCVAYDAFLCSSIVAANTSDGLSLVNVRFFDGSGRVDGSNNLIGESRNVDLPPDTIQSDPLLAPLADNGGPTLTHALLPDSPAIDAGNNVTLAQWDQRGDGFARVIGAAADIGAFEALATNQAPVAENDDYSTVGNTTLTVSAPGVLADDSDPDGNPLTAVLVDDASNGQLTLNMDGSFIYVPASGFSGSDSFTYEANDGQSNSNIATVTIEVLQDPDQVFASGFE